MHGTTTVILKKSFTDTQYIAIVAPQTRNYGQEGVFAEICSSGKTNSQFIIHNGNKDEHGGSGSINYWMAYGY